MKRAMGKDVLEWPELRALLTRLGVALQDTAVEVYIGIADGAPVEIRVVQQGVDTCEGRS